MQDDSSGEPAQGFSLYELFMFGLGLYALTALGVQTLVPLCATTLRILDFVDNGLCLVFFADFVFRLRAAPSKSAYLLWGWLDLLSSIPLIDAFRMGRVARIIRILRAFRSVRWARFIVSHLSQHRGGGVFYGAALLSVLLVVFASIAVLQFETGPESNIRTADDAVWWAFTTITTVGYGDKFPVTLEGRCIAGILMIAGVGMFATFTGLTASWIMAPTKVDLRQDSELSHFRSELLAIRRILEPANSGSDANHNDDDWTELGRLWPDLDSATRGRILDLAQREHRKAA